MSSRVGQIAVTLKLADADRDRSDETRRIVEQVLIQQALDELERLVHERFGREAVVRVRRLAVRWRLDHDLLGDPATAIALGRDLAASLVADIDALPRPQRLRPIREANVVMFAEPDHALAACLADRAEQRDAWFHPISRDAIAEWIALVAARSPRIESVMRWLDRMERREQVVRWLATNVTPRPAASTAIIDETPRATPATATAALASIDAHEPGATAQLDPRSTFTSEQAGAPAVSAHDVAVHGLPEITHFAATTLPTAFAGLWYLVRLVLELDLAEQLWAAGVREGDFLAHVALAIAGPGAFDDPGWRCFGGALDHEPLLDPLAAWAAEELAVKLDASLRRLVPDAPALAALAGQLPARDIFDPRTSEAISRSAAAVCTLFCARLGVAPDATLVRSHIAIRGRIETEESIRVVIGMDLVDVDLRRAGLDFEPGYVPWLGRRVQLAFES